MAVISSKTKADFKKDVIENKKVVLVDFWASWCPPCRMMAPVLEAIGQKMDENVDVVKVNIEESPDNNALASEYNVRSIPNMLIFKDGQVVQELIGVMPQVKLEEELSAVLK